MRAPSIIAGGLVLLTTVGLSVSSAATWTVTSTADSGPGTLRSSIDSANASAAARDTIAFNIAGAGPHTITPATGLPSIVKDGVLIDGYTQPGAVANTLASGDNAVLKVVLSVTGVFYSLIIDADSCTIRGLVLTDGIRGIDLAGSSTGNVIEGNFIGVDVTGTSASGNEEGIAVSGLGGNLIGGTVPAARNIISGNSARGILIFPGSMRNTVQGNYVGTDRNGTAALGNGNVGINISADSNSIGGTTPGARNVISSNPIGILIGAGTGNIIEGNFVGTDRSGTAALGNTNRGIDIVGSPGNTIGGSTAAAGNVISCNTYAQILLSGDASKGNVIIGNLIGTDVTGLAALSNPGIGIDVFGADSNFIGQTGVLRNIFGGLAGAAILVEFGADGNTITSNCIGVGIDGITPIPNANIGILISISSLNQIGDTALFPPGNIIANATGGSYSAGIGISGSSIGNRLLGNAIRDNAGIGIDLGADIAVAANDVGDGDIGPNDLQNYPVLTDGKILAGGTYVVGSLNSEPSTSYYVQVYANSSCDPSGYGEGRAIVDTFTVTTDLAGDVSFSHNMINDVGDTVLLTATATNPSGSTSEFSTCAAVSDAIVVDTLEFYLFSPVNMVVTDPLGDSIGIDSASGVVFNTILNGSSYDSTTDLNSSDLSGPDGSSDDIVTIPSPIAGDYVVRLYREDGAADTMNFTAGIRINGNQFFAPDDYYDQEVGALGSTVSNTFVWTAATTLPGDCNASGSTTSADIIYLVNYVFKGGAAPVVEGHGDVNCNGTVTSADVIYLVNFVFKSGLSPCSHTAG